MAEQKPDIVKAFVDLKKGILQLEGPQEFVEKYLDPIIRNSKIFTKPSPKPEPTVEEKEQIRQYKKSTIKTFGRLSMGIFTVSLIVGIKEATILNVLGAIAVLSVIYLVIPHLKQEWFLRKIAQVVSILDACNWFIALALFALLLLQKASITGITWLAIIAILIMFAAFAVFYASIWKAGKIKDSGG
jgi:hypothetical protein